MIDYVKIMLLIYSSVTSISGYKLCIVMIVRLYLLELRTIVIYVKYTVALLILFYAPYIDICICLVLILSIKFYMYYVFI